MMEMRQVLKCQIAAPSLGLLSYRDVSISIVLVVGLFALSCGPCMVTGSTTKPPAICYPSPCLNQGMCFSNETSPSGYVCRCYYGYSGENCETGPPPCERSPCEYGGTCSEDSSSANGYVCQCPVGYEGDQCQVVPSQCDPSPCMNGGRCFLDLVSPGNYSQTCRCSGGYSGDECQVPPCGNTPCQNSGTCSVNATAANGYTCQCARGYAGDQCELSDALESATDQHVSVILIATLISIALMTFLEF